MRLTVCEQWIILDKYSECYSTCFSVFLIISCTQSLLEVVFNLLKVALTFHCCTCCLSVVLCVLTFHIEKTNITTYLTFHTRYFRFYAHFGPKELK